MAIHIRDLMVADKNILKESGTVPNVTMCGLHDPDMNKLAFGDYRYILQGKVKGACEKCIKKFKEEENSDKSYKKAYHEFRKLIFKAVRGGHNPNQR